MPCYYPIMAVQPYPGARPLLFGRGQEHIYRATHGKHFHVPCLRCAGCRKRSALEWATRCEHELQMHRYNSYITLTYDDRHLPPNSTLVHRDWVLFLKTLRNYIKRDGANILLSDAAQLKSFLGLSNRNWNAINCASREKTEKRSTGLQTKTDSSSALYVPSGQTVTDTGIKFYMAGEYGEKYGRPHYHAILFGLDFADRTYRQRSKAGEKIYTSPTLEKLWPYGYSSIGNATFASAAYIARYVVKKRTGDGNKYEYEILDLETGEINKKKKEYNCMSRAEGIGQRWLHTYHSDVYTLDKVVTKNGRTLRPPRYYDKQFKRLDAARLEHLKHVRELEALAQAEHHTPERLAVQEAVATAQARFQRRNFE